jgi:hypothetical protein
MDFFTSISDNHLRLGLFDMRRGCEQVSNNEYLSGHNRDDSVPDRILPYPTMKLTIYHDPKIIRAGVLAVPCSVYKLFLSILHG